MLHRGKWTVRISLLHSATWTGILGAPNPRSPSTCRSISRTP